MSVNAGETQRFKVSTPASAYRLDIYRMGHYGGAGARLVGTVTRSGRQSQPGCLSSASTGLVDCGNWAVSASWPVPVDAVSGIYFARLVRTDGTNGASHVFFVVRDDASHSDLLVQTADTTWQAYNRFGGNSLYTGSPAGRAYKVSYNRPFTTRSTSSEDFVFNAEYPMVRFLEGNGYDVSYFSGADTDRHGALLRNHKVFVSMGHDEYWSGGQRANVEAARDAGVHLAFFSGNEVFWKTRWESSIDGSGTPYRTLVSYKETHADAVIDPAAPVWTGTWRDPRFSPPGDGGRPENALTGTSFKVNAGTVALRVPAADGRLRFWRGTGNTGPHAGHLWSRTGQLLGTATFSGGTGTGTGGGWRQASFAAPVPIAAGTTYVASYYAPNGHYAADADYFAASGVDSAPLRALTDGQDGPNGVYRYGAGGGFPTNTWQASNYWVDIVFVAG